MKTLDLRNTIIPKRVEIKFPAEKPRLIEP